MPHSSHMLYAPPCKIEAESLSQALQAEEASVPSLRAEPMLVSIAEAIVLGGLLLWLYFSTLAHLVAQWWHDPNFSHGFFVPLFSAFVVWQERQRFAQLAPQPSRLGFVLLCSALFFLVVGQMGAELFIARSSLLLLLGGIVVLFFGWAALRAAFFPWAFLLLMIPIPNILLNQITFPLQLLASRLAGGVLSLVGVPVLREGNVINLSTMALE